MIDFDLFNDVASNSDMEMPNCGELILDEHLLSSFEDSSGPVSSSPGPDCFYFIPELSSTCSEVNPNEMRNGGIESKLFLKNEESGIWVFADKEVENLGAAPKNTVESYLETTTKSKFSTGQIVEPPTMLPFKRSTQKPKDASSYPRNGDGRDHGRSTSALTITGKRKIGTLSSSTSTGDNKRLRDELQISTTSARSRSSGFHKVATKVTNGSTVLSEEFLKTLTDSITQQISSTVRQEVKLAMDGFKTYLDEKFLQAGNKFTQDQHNCDPREKGGKSPAYCRNINPQRTVEVSDSFGINIRSGCQEQENHLRESESKLAFGETYSNAGDNKSEKNQATKRIKPGQTQTNQSELIDLELQSRSVEPSHSEIFEECQVVTMNSAMKYVTFGSQIKTPEKSNEPCNIDHDDNLNSTDIVIISTNTIEFKPRGDCDIFVLEEEMIKREELSDVNNGLSQTEDPLDAVKMESVNEFVEQQQSEIKMEKEESAILVPEEQCTALVPYVPQPSTKTDMMTMRHREHALKPELAMRKYKKPLICDVCNRSFLNNSSLRQHVSFHKPQRPYLCSERGCQKSYKTRSELNRHLIVHTGQKNYECRKCGKSFLRKQYLKTHLIRHNEGLTWQCTICAKIFVSEEDLSRHKVSYHKNGKRSSLLMIAQPQKLAITFHLEDSLEV